MCPACFGIKPAVPAPSGTSGPVATAYTDAPGVTSASTIELEPSSGTDSACTLIWVETVAEDIANKNRAMVWEQVIKDRVVGSGMTDKQFYEQVVEHNPGLKADGYVFQDGKTYYLPECQ